MSGVALIGTVLYVALLIYFLALWARFILDLVQAFSESWRPRGAVLVLAEASFTVTDPPIKAVRRVVKPLRTGGIVLDFSWSIVMLAVVILIYVTLVLR